jgi:DNA-directed RNA polymerase II subunit RPB2
MEDISWKLIDKYFQDNPYNLVSHHLDSYNNFYNKQINNVFRENNPIRFLERKDEDDEPEKRNECLLYLGGKSGEKIYYGKPIIYDDDNAHYMYPNEARLRNMTYGITIHYDVEIEYVYYKDDEKIEHSQTLEQIYLGRFPIMMQSDLCILKTLAPDVRFYMGECKNDYGGYFIIDGKEKAIVSQEKFADNMLYIKENKADELYSHYAEIRSVSEDASKPIRKITVSIVAPTSVLSNNQIVVNIPDIKKPIPLFILMRALGATSDKQIIEYCLLDLSKNESYVDLFIPSIQDASMIFNQETALRYISQFTRRGTINGLLEILMNAFLPHIGTMNFLDKAYYLGYMVKSLLKVFTKESKPTDRDHFRCKRIEMSGNLLYELFRDYLIAQNTFIGKKIDKEFYYHIGKYKDDFVSLIEDNYHDFFKKRMVESGFRKSFKGNWGADLPSSSSPGIVQDLNRLSWNSFISQLRKLNLPLDASAKVVGPRLLHSSQWGYIDPTDTPDGGNIGLHKHLSISTLITSGSSSEPLIKWMRCKTKMKLLLECSSQNLYYMTKVFVNGNWIGAIETPLETMKLMKMYRRNGIIPIYTSISFNYEANELHIYTDSGRLCRPIYYIDDKRVSYDRAYVKELISTNKFTWEQICSGFGEKEEGYSNKNNKLYELEELYPNLGGSSDKIDEELNKNKSVVDYIDPSEEESSLVANNASNMAKSKYYTNVEIDPSLLLGVMGNQIIYPENNPSSRNAFSCGQSKQAVSLYNTNYQMRIDKMAVVLNYGQIPLIKSRYLEYINKEEMPYGVNTIVAIMSYTGYNVEDAILVNSGSVDRGLFRTTYLSMYESREETSKIGESNVNSRFDNVYGVDNVTGLRIGYDYSELDEHGLIKENTELHDKKVVIGKVSYAEGESEVVDSSVFPKKGQLGFVDKAFITEGEEGTRIAKIRVREERIPAIGDKMASRAGQKGTIGIIIPEEDMPFTADGTKPDLIINPHALPSRMTIGQLMECLFGKVCTSYGGFGEGTAFLSKGANTKEYGRLLVKEGFHASGSDILYNGMSGEQLYSDIYMGPTYYMRLKHMVKDKINSRPRGPNTGLTRQPVQGRANDGGLRIGEMERDGIMAHGASAFLKESFMERADEYSMAVCNKSGCIAVYNTKLNLFMSPFVDGPFTYHKDVNGDLNIEQVTQFGRSFSLVRVPYSLKLLIQELQIMNIQMRIITEDNIDQLMNLSYSDNINRLLGDPINGKLNPALERVIQSYKTDMEDKKREATRKINKTIKNDSNPLPRGTSSEEEIVEKQKVPKVSYEEFIRLTQGLLMKLPEGWSIEWSDELQKPYYLNQETGDKIYDKEVFMRMIRDTDSSSIPYAPDYSGDVSLSPAYQGQEWPESPDPTDFGGPDYMPESQSNLSVIPIDANNIVVNTSSSPYNPFDSNDSIPKPIEKPSLTISNPNIQEQYNSLTPSDQAVLMEMVAEKQSNNSEDNNLLDALPIIPMPKVAKEQPLIEDNVPSILKIEDKAEETDEDNDKKEESAVKSVSFN